MTDVCTRAGDLAEQIETELRRLHCWQAEPPSFDAERDGPFGMHTMAFEQWLQVVLVPALRDVATGARAMPAGSSLAVHAMREFDGRDDRQALAELLRQVDGLSGVPAGSSAQRRSWRTWVGLVLLLVWAAPSGTFAGDVATLLFARPPGHVTLAASVDPGGRTWGGLRVVGTAEQRDDRLHFASVTLVPGRSAGTSTVGRVVDVQCDAAQPLPNGEFSPVGLLRAVGRDEAPGADTEALFAWLRLLRRPVAGAEVEAGFRNFTQAAGEPSGSTFELTTREVEHGDFRWLLGFCLLYLPVAIAVLVVVMRLRRRS